MSRKLWVCEEVLWEVAKCGRENAYKQYRGGNYKHIHETHPMEMEKKTLKDKTQN